jgi:ankyrin repeat protein
MQLRLLLEHGADVNALAADGSTPLMRMAANAQCTKELLRILLDGGADAYFAARDGMTPLLKVVSERRGYDQLRLILDHRAVISLADRLSNGAVHHLANNGQAEVLSQMLEKELLTQAIGCVHAPNLECMTPLQLAASLDASYAHRRLKSLFGEAEHEWQTSVLPFISSTLINVIPVSDLARLCLEYIDGGGRPQTTRVEGLLEESAVVLDV